MAVNPFEIPQVLRDVSEQNLKHAHAAYEQLMDFMTKAMGAWIAMENAESAFTFAGKICKAQTVQEIVTLQTQFAQDRMQAFVTQTQQLLYSLIGEALQKLQRG